LLVLFSEWFEVNHIEHHCNITSNYSNALEEWIVFSIDNNCAYNQSLVHKQRVIV
jgi:hypothetical protein